MRIFVVSALLAGLACVSPASAKIAGATLDGTWDCVDDGNSYVGTVIVANTTYAFTNLEGIVAGYGTLDRFDDPYFDLPVFVIVDGFLKEDLGATGLSMEGPRENILDYSGELFLRVGISPENRPFCTRRKSPIS